MSSTLLDLWVPGRPRTKGSLRGGRTGAGGVRLADSKLSKLWRADVENAVVRRIADEDLSVPEGRKGRWRLRGGWPILDPVVVSVTFQYERVKADDWYPTGQNFGDVDKLLRNVLDALQSAGLYKDDAQVQSVFGRKVFGVEAGASIVVRLA